MKDVADSAHNTQYRRWPLIGILKLEKKNGIAKSPSKSTSLERTWLVPFPRRREKGRGRGGACQERKRSRDPPHPFAGEGVLRSVSKEFFGPA